MSNEKEFSVQTIKWLEYSSNLLQEQKELYANEQEYDSILISSDGKQFKTHQIILSGSSEFFYNILKDVPAAINPTIYIPDAKAIVIESLLTFIYTGETSIPSAHLSDILDMCQFLQIKGFISSDCLVNGIKVSLDDYMSHENHTIITTEESAVGNENYVLLEDYESKDLIGTNSDDEFSIEYLECEEYDGNSNSNENENTDEKLCDSNDEIIENNSDSEFKDCGPLTMDNTAKNKLKRKKSAYRQVSRNINSEIDQALSEVAKGKTIHQLSLEYNLPRSTLYHKFRKNESLKKNYRSERRSALDQAVRTVMEEQLSLKKAADRYNLPKTAIWRELKKYHQYQPPTKEPTQDRQNAQNEIILGKSLTSISLKYSIPLTTLHRDKKRLSLEGKLPEGYRVKDRTENSEYGKRLEQALQKCRQGMSQYQAAKLFNIPKATMWRYAHALLKADQQNVFNIKTEEDDSLDIEVETN